MILLSTESNNEIQKEAAFTPLIHSACLPYNQPDCAFISIILLIARPIMSLVKFKRTIVAIVDGCKKISTR